MAVGASRIAAGDTGAGPDWAPPGQAASWAGLMLLVAVAVGLLGQGAYYGPARRLLGLLVAAATLLALVAWPLTRDDLRRLPALPAAALAGWAALDAVLLGLPVTGAAGLALLLTGLVAVL
ncbi:MAG TPA: hypothetical protein VH016_13965, partial [Actinomycetota bacterium]|nr:hypothetical protein [Actinomycetota bacterium]